MRDISAQIFVWIVHVLGLLQEKSNFYGCLLCYTNLEHIVYTINGVEVIKLTVPLTSDGFVEEYGILQDQLRNSSGYTYLMASITGILQ